MFTAAFITLGILTLTLVILYNGHVSRRNQVNYAFASIDVQLKKRCELIPNLVNLVKGYTNHEKELFEQVTHARKQALDSSPHSSNRFTSENYLDKKLPSLIAIAEAYPDLQTDKQFLNLQRNLSEIEAQVAAARRAYNASVMNYNNGIEMFPSSIIAHLFNFTHRPHFEATAADREVKNVSL